MVDDVKNNIVASIGSEVVPIIQTRDIFPGIATECEGNEQTDQLLHVLNLNHIWTIGTHESATRHIIKDDRSVLSSIPQATADSNEIDLEDL